MIEKITDQFKDSFEKGQQDRAEAKRNISSTLANLKKSLEETDLVTADTTDYDGLFVRLKQSSDRGPGWWTYLQVNTRPDGLSYTIIAGFGRKNEPQSLHDCAPEFITDKIDEALEIFQNYLNKGMYYLGTLKK